MKKLNSLLKNINNNLSEEIIFLSDSFADKILGGKDGENATCTNNGCNGGTNVSCQNYGCGGTIKNTICDNY